jgi:hypothetical protein
MMPIELTGDDLQVMEKLAKEYSEDGWRDFCATSFMGFWQAVVGSAGLTAEEEAMVIIPAEARAAQIRDGV